MQFVGATFALYGLISRYTLVCSAKNAKNRKMFEAISPKPLVQMS